MNNNEQVYASLEKKSLFHEFFKTTPILLIV
jgi:hypothetical protein